MYFSTPWYSKHFSLKKKYQQNNNNITHNNSNNDGDDDEDDETTTTPITLRPEEIMRDTFQMRRNETHHRDIDFFVLWEIGVKTTTHQDDGNDGSAGNGEFKRRQHGIVNSQLTS